MSPSPSQQVNPLISQWIDCAEPGVIRARTGKSELGQGIATALAQVVADATCVNVSRVRMVPPTTDGGPNEGFTAGSLSVQHSGSALFSAGVTMRRLFAAEACGILGASHVEVVDGRFMSGDQGVTYWELADRVNLSIDFESPADFNQATGAIGSSLARSDLADKVLGYPRFLHDMRLPGQLYGRVLRPPYRGAVLVSFDRTRVEEHPGVVTVVVDGSFVGIVAATEIGAREALEIARTLAEWSGPAHPLGSDHVAAFLTAEPAQVSTITFAETHVREASATPVTFRGRYSRPFLAHASIGPSVAVALQETDNLHVWTHSQGVFPLRADIARALDMPLSDVHVAHVEGAGCYGHNGADDAAYDAALLARSTPGHPVHVTWSREDELGWAPFGPAMVVDIESACAPDGTITKWSWTGYGNGHSSRPSTLLTPSLLAFAHESQGQAIPASEDPPPAAGHGTGRNAIPGYDVGEVSAVIHRCTEMPMRASALRSLGAHLNVFAIEEHMDDMARHFGGDPLEYRLRHLSDTRGRAVLEQVAQMCDWPNRPGGEDVGRGLGYARYKGTGAWCAVVVDLAAQERVHLKHMWIAVDVGRVVNPDGVVNQIEGGAIQSASWTLLEQVRFADGRVLSDTWEEYPILTFTDVPPIDVAIVDSRDEPWLGAGETSIGPTAAAIGNALTDATGIRVRSLPLSPENIVAAMDELP